ncbi:aspartate aminotransferase family protein [Mesoterricola sediminis]|uniref:Acetylornithine aminotransferase n=1 Tax=Mesoterricola sediminis TaxID=2927980 RepID=A0AA48KD85_9BACT|nr:aminotransferase class III-fold pyridoxal phosphate-dependent enzyme [Mesoterricola sediminis]BDU77931.1 acetylornithine aminotransferase [Mesoterricola sediminis]
MNANLQAPALLPTYTPFPFPLLRGENDRVFDPLGQSYWDFYGGHCVASTGHAHPRVAEAVAAQAKELIFYSTAAELPVRSRAAQELLAFTASGRETGLSSIFFCNSGAEANENALKMACRITGRKRFAAFQGGWHGRTLLALSVTDDPPITGPYEGLLAPCLRLPWNDLEALAAADFSDVAGVILEPIQSMSGIRPATPEFLQALRAKTLAEGALLIYDEVQTGVGRLGHPYAAGLHGVRPDIVTSAKGLASGVPMGAILLGSETAACIRPGDLGSTFGGGPIACAALIATLQVIRQEGLLQNALAREAAIRKALAGTCVTEVRGAGLLLGLVVPGRAKALKAHLQTHRILVGGSSDPDALRLMPPLTLTQAAVDALAEAVTAFGKEN